MSAGAQGAGLDAARPHLLAVRSVVFGTCNLLLLGVPAGWRLGDGAFPPEVDRWHVRDGVSWATAGRGHWWLAARTGTGGRAALRAELFLQVTPAGAVGAGPGTPAAEAASAAGRGGRNAGPRPGKGGAQARASGKRGGGRPAARDWGLGRIDATGSCLLDGHPGWWAAGAVRRGFPGRWRPARALVLECSFTRRRLYIRLEAAPGGEPGDLEAAWEALLAEWRCH